MSSSKKVRCSCNKAAFSSYNKARSCANGFDKDARVYFCYEAGAYHITRYERGENDALHAQRKKDNAKRGR